MSGPDADTVRKDNMDTAKLRRVFSAFPELETERLLLKKIVPQNAFDMYAYASLDDVTRYLLWTPHLNIDETRGYIEFLQTRYRKGEYADWGINCKADGHFIGTIGFADLVFGDNRGEIGYVLNPEYQGKGYMREAMREIQRFAFTVLGLHRAELRIMEGNTASERLALATGFKYEGTAREALLVKGVYRTIRSYAMLASEYFSL